MRCFDSPSLTDLPVRPPNDELRSREYLTVAEYYTDRVLHRLERRYAGALNIFLTLLAGQRDVYRTHEPWVRIRRRGGPSSNAGDSSLE
jgi:hypothetical protein